MWLRMCLQECECVCGRCPDLLSRNGCSSNKLSVTCRPQESDLAARPSAASPRTYFSPCRLFFVFRLNASDFLWTLDSRPRQNNLLLCGRCYVSPAGCILTHMVSHSHNAPVKYGLFMCTLNPLLSKILICISAFLLPLRRKSRAFILNLNQVPKHGHSKRLGNSQETYFE